MRSKYFIVLLISIGLLSAMLSIAQAASFKYYTDISIANTSGVAYTTRIAFTANAQALVSNSYMKSNGSDTDLTYAGSSEQLASTNLAATNASWFTGIISVPAQSNQTHRLYLGDNSYSRRQSITSLTTDTVSIAHNTNLNIVNNLTIEASGTYLYSAPTATQYFIRKPNQYELQVTTTSYRFVITPTTSQTVEIISPTASSTTNLSVVGASSNWQAVSSNDATTSYVSTISDSYVTDYYIMSNTSYPEGTVVSVGASATWKGTSPTWSVSVLPVLRLGSSDTFGTVISKVDTAWSTESWINLARPGGGSWTMADINDLLAGVALSGRTASGTESWVSYFSINVEYTTASAVSSSLTLNSNKTIKGTYNGSNLVMYVDGISVATAPLISTIATSTATLTWQFNGLMDRISIGDTSIASATWRLYYDFEPSQISSNTITDLSVSNNPASITWTANPASVTATMGSLVPISSYTLTSGSSSQGPIIVATIPAMNMTQESEGSTLPLAGLFQWAASNSGLPIQTFWILAAMISSTFAGILSFSVLQSMTFGAAASGIVAGGFALAQIWPWWVLIFYAMIVAGAILFDKSVSI